MSKNITVLVVEDSASLGVVYSSYLENAGFKVAHVESGQEALTLINKQIPDILLLDIQLPDISGMEILRHVNSNQLPTITIMITAHGSTEIAVDAMKNGAFDFISKPFDADRLLVTVNNAIKNLELIKIVDIYKEKFERHQYHKFIGSSLAMQSVYQIIDSAAQSKATIFVTGESGTGKELCADAIHHQSPRKEKELVAINCAAIPRDLIESEIFGHVKGAFTGASAVRQGAASTADGGTLFLDEICEMDLDLQSKLLRFIQTGTFQKVGSNKTEMVDVRFVCATNKDPLEEVNKGNFREDLYYRLHVIPIVLPPLRDREDDVTEISRIFLETFSKEENKKFKDFDDEVKIILRSFHWPGNIRQLQNVIRNIVVLNDANVVDKSMLPPPLNAIDSSLPKKAIVSPSTSEDSPTANGFPQKIEKEDAELIRPLWIIEKEAIDRAISLCDNNIPKAAALLEVSASTIYRKKQSWESQNKC